jgi:uracil-DNA glycosylase
LEEEMRRLRNVRVAIALGGIAFRTFLDALRATGHTIPKPRPRFRHAAVWRLGPIDLVASYHPSQRNTQTGLLTESSFDEVFRTARRLLDGDREGTANGRDSQP